MNSGPSQGMGPGPYRGQQPPPPQQQMMAQHQQYGGSAGPGPGPGYDPRRGPPPPQQQMQGPQGGPGQRNVMHRAPPAGAGGRRF